jgi:aryl-alcohol dehydrogenase-like predicted oxidoreductase/GrpB-like predicted nucleotidyltransferase (UPF0157 family)
MTIGRYRYQPAEHHEFDPGAAAVAARLAELIRASRPSLVVEHVGSTAVPGCRGKGVIDLAVLYPGDGVAEARETLDALGFQRQEGRDPWPETRPMRVGAWTDAGRTFRIHAHVVAQESREHAEMLWFRDRLRADPALVERYHAAKRAILDRGVTDTYDYAIAKGDFVAGELGRWRTGLPAASPGPVTIGGELVVNRIGFGAMQLPGKGVWGEPADPARARAVLRRAVALGVNLIDTADYYGPEVANRLLYEALHPYPADLVIATKVGYRRGPDRSWQPDHAPDRIRSAVDDNLRRLRRDHLDLVHLRLGGSAVPLGDSLGALADLVREGKVRHVGLSQASLADLAEAERLIRVASVSNLYSAADRGADPVLHWCTERGIPFLPFFPLGAGRLGNPNSSLARLAAAHGITATQLALAWLLHRSPIMTPIPGTSSIAHLEENVSAGAIRLSPELAETIGSIRNGAA